MRLLVARAPRETGPGVPFKRGREAMPCARARGEAADSCPVTAAPARRAGGGLPHRREMGAVGRAGLGLGWELGRPSYGGKNKKKHFQTNKNNKTR